MTVNEIPVNIRCLEYRQDKKDADYGSCLYARFYFNLDWGELTIVSDVGNYAYRWGVSENETFLELMVRITKGYLCGKLCGSPKEFDYESTKDHMYDYWGVEEHDKEILDRIFEEIELTDGAEQSADIFLKAFDDNNYDTDYRHAYFCDVWEMVQYSYTPWQERICKIFVENIQPKIREILSKENEDE